MVRVNCILGFKVLLGCFTLSLIFCEMCFVMNCQRGRLLGAKTLGTNVLELHFVFVGKP